MGATGVALGCLFDFKKSRSAMVFFFLFGYLRYLQRLFELTGVKELVEQFYNLFGAQRHHAHAGAHQALLDNRHALLKLRAVLLELLVGERRVAAFAAGDKRRDSRAARDKRRVIGHHDKKVFCHDRN